MGLERLWLYGECAYRSATTSPADREMGSFFTLATCFQDLGLKPEQEQVPLLLSMPLSLAQMLALDLNPLLSLSQLDKQDPHLSLFATTYVTASVSARCKCFCLRYRFFHWDNLRGKLETLLGTMDMDMVVRMLSLDKLNLDMDQLELEGILRSEMLLVNLPACGLPMMPLPIMPLFMP